MDNKKKIAVVLSGCGVYDGSEIHEATLTLYAISKLGAEYQIFAPDIDQFHVINHFTGEVTNEKRNVLVESARIARGKIEPLSSFNVNEYDAIVFPGGFGAAKNLSTFAFKGSDCNVDSDTEKAVKGMFNSKKPIAALCIAPALIAKILGNVEVTIGNEEGTANAINKMGAIHKNSGPAEIVVDEKNKIVTTPCYMLQSNISQIGEGAEKTIKAVLELIG
ncbi:MAG: isoprenoid biosynthesis glyoxalase ElbB [Bacteroidota bacterium]